MKDMKTVFRADDFIASYSSKGPTLFDQIAKPDLVAPGNKIIAALPTGIYLTNTYPGNKVPQNYYILGGTGQPSDFYYELSGTSRQGRMVAGAAALLKEKPLPRNPDKIKARLKKTATKIFPVSSVAIDINSGNAYTTQYDLFTVGAGYLDVWA